MKFKLFKAEDLDKVVDKWVKNKIVDSRRELSEARLVYGFSYQYDYLDN